MPKSYNLIGEKFGRLTVVTESPEKKKSNTCKTWVCKCDCGNMCVVPTNRLRSGNTKSCGCIHKQKYPKDLTGIRFGSLIVIERDEDKVLPSGQTAKMWKCRCDCCGRTVSVMRTNLVSGATRSCGSGCTRGILIRDRASIQEFNKMLEDKRCEAETRRRQYQEILGVEINDAKNVIHLNCDRNDYRPENLWYNPNASALNSRLNMFMGIGFRDNTDGSFITKNDKLLSCALRLFQLTDIIRKHGGNV